jgi:hypothetical protein
MTLALQSPETITGLIPVDNAPVNARLDSSFFEYVKGMKEIEATRVAKTSDADKILTKYEPVTIDQEKKNQNQNSQLY